VTTLGSANLVEGATVATDSFVVQATDDTMEVVGWTAATV
jgi:hypothetical protein